MLHWGTMPPISRVNRSSMTTKSVSMQCPMPAPPGNNIDPQLTRTAVDPGWQFPCVPPNLPQRWNLWENIQLTAECGPGQSSLSSGGDKISSLLSPLHLHLSCPVSSRIHPFRQDSTKLFSFSVPTSALPIQSGSQYQETFTLQDIPGPVFNLSWHLQGFLPFASLPCLHANTFEVSFAGYFSSCVN